MPGLMLPRAGPLGLAAVLACVAMPRFAHARPLLAAGGIAGVTLGPSEYFPAFLGGIMGEGEVRVSGHLAVGLTARVQLYSHREEEDYGSWGGHQDLSAAVRVSLLDESDTGARAIPFLSGRAGGAIVERVPFRDRSSTEGIGGYSVGVSMGVAFRRTRERPALRAALSFDLPSFTTHDDKLGPVGELSLSFVAIFDDEGY